MPTRLGQVGHGLGVDASGMEQRSPGLDNLLTAVFIRRRTTVIPQVHRPQRLVADHPRRFAVDADKTQAAEQVQIGG
ncbi:hypothetical protein D3C85_1735760 [compost metagenome]